MDGMNVITTIEGVVDAEAFHAYVRHELVPALRLGDIMLMDNPSAHKVQNVVEWKGGVARYNHRVEQLNLT